MRHIDDIAAKVRRAERIDDAEAARLWREAPRYRTLIVMRFFDEYSYEEIAANLKLPLGTVKTQIHRAREQMCRLITEGEKN